MIYLHETIRLEAHAQNGAGNAATCPESDTETSNQQKCTPASFLATLPALYLPL